MVERYETVCMYTNQIGMRHVVNNHTNSYYIMFLFYFQSMFIMNLMEMNLGCHRSCDTLTV